MTATLSILAMGVGVYALRLVGLALPNVALPPTCERALRFMPVALLAALITANLSARADGGLAPFVAVSAGAVIAQRTRRMWTCIVGGMACYWLVRWIGDAGWVWNP